MKFNKNINRNSRYLKVKDLRSEEKGVSQCIAYTLTRIAIVLLKIKFYNCSKYKILQYRSISKVIDPFFRVYNCSLRIT